MHGGREFVIVLRALIILYFYNSGFVKNFIVVMGLCILRVLTRSQSVHTVTTQQRQSHSVTQSLGK